MTDLVKSLDSIKQEVQDVQAWADSQYDAYFAEYFKGQQALYSRISSTDDPITDSELEWALVSLPLELFKVSEALSKMRTMKEVIALNIKDKEYNYVNDDSIEGSASKKKEDAAHLSVGDRLLLAVYENIMDRVAKEVSFSRELIMSAKKIWDARRSADLPVTEIPSEKETLPEYKI